MKVKSKRIKSAVIAILCVFALSIIFAMPSAILAQEEEAETETDVPEEISFDIPYPEVKAKFGESFNFKVDVSYKGDEPLTFDVNWEAPEGWYVRIKPSYQETEISAVKLDPGQEESWEISAAPQVKVEPGDYPIKIIASNEDIGLEATAEITAVITASYDMDLATKTGRLNTEVTSGKDNKYTLVVNNTGTDSIENISLSTQEPEGWLVNFDNDDIETIESGDKKEIVATIKPPEKTVAGDYVLTLNASSENAQDSLELRVTVLTPTIWGWVGIGIIVIVIVGVAIIFARLGRR